MVDCKQSNAGIMDCLLGQGSECGHYLLCLMCGLPIVFWIDQY